MIRYFYLIILVLIAHYDVKTLEINDKFLTLLAGSIIIWTPSAELEGNLPAAAAVWILFAAACVISSLAGRYAPIGMGDIKLFSLLALSHGGLFTMMIFCASGFFSGIFAAALLLMKKASKDSEIPFAPFIAAGYAICLLAAFI